MLQNYCFFIARATNGPMKVEGVKDSSSTPYYDL